jgi:hypothetical protein
MKKIAMLVLVGIFFAFAVVSAQSPKKPADQGDHLRGVDYNHLRLQRR